MNTLIVLPQLIPMFTAIICLMAWRHVRRQQLICVAGSVAHLIGGIFLMRLTLQEGFVASSIGDWPVPFGIVYAVDILGAVMVLLTGLMATAVSIYAIADIDEGRLAHGFCPLFQTLIMGVSGSFMTGDLFNLYVQFEIMLTASFVLLTLGGERRQMIGGIKYVTLNLVASAIFLAGVGVLYGMTGTLNMADLGQVLRDNPSTSLVATLATMFLIAFGLKAAAFPMFFWLPAAYHSPPASVSALFAGLLTKVGLFSLIRVFTLLFTSGLAWTHGLLLTIAGLSMVVGVLGAVAQTELRRLLSFQIVSHIGYILMGLGLIVALDRVGGFEPVAGAVADGIAADGGLDESTIRSAVALGLTGGIVYVMHHIVTATNLFLLAGVIERDQGTGVMASMGSLSRRLPLLGVLFMLSSLALAGVPPLSGFWAKAALIKAGLGIGATAVVVAALLTGVLTLYSMMAAWAAMFWRERNGSESLSNSADDDSPAGAMDRREASLRFGPILGLTAVMLVIGLYPRPFFDVAERAADQLLHPSRYTEAIMSIETSPRTYPKAKDAAYGDAKDADADADAGADADAVAGTDTVAEPAEPAAPAGEPEPETTP